MELITSGREWPYCSYIVQEEVGRTLYNLGVDRLNDKKLDVAFAYFCDVISYMRNESNKHELRDKVRHALISQSYNNVGVIHHQWGNNRLAIINLEEALKEDPSLREARLNLEALSAISFKLAKQ